MMILADFYLAFALLLAIAAAGLMLWHLWAQPEHNSRLKVAAALLFISAAICVGCVTYYGTHLMDQGDCPYTLPLAPCPVTSTTTPSRLMQQLPDEHPIPDPRPKAVKAEQLAGLHP